MTRWSESPLMCVGRVGRLKWGSWSVFVAHNLLGRVNTDIGTRVWLHRIEVHGCLLPEPQVLACQEPVQRVYRCSWGFGLVGKPGCSPRYGWGRGYAGMLVEPKASRGAGVLTGFRRGGALEVLMELRAGQGPGGALELRTGRGAGVLTRVWKGRDV